MGEIQQQALKGGRLCLLLGGVNVSRTGAPLPQEEDHLSKFVSV